MMRGAAFQGEALAVRQCGHGSNCAIGRQGLVLARQFNRWVAATVAAMLVAACSGVNIRMAHDKDEDAKSDATDYGQVASLQSIGGSAIFGKIRVIDRGDGASVLVSMMNVPPGPYRIAIQETPNCSSPNGFAAGRAWAPAGMDPHTFIPVQYVNSEDRVEQSLRVPALRTKGPNGVAGHSVVVYAGSRITDALPGVPNERMACGVFEQAHRISF
jgi:Cu/Zn superoxide dismutase